MYVRKRCYFNWFWAKGNICSILCVCVSIGKRDRREKYIQWEISLLEGPSHSEFGLVTHCTIVWPCLPYSWMQLHVCAFVPWNLSRKEDSVGLCIRMHEFYHPLGDNSRRRRDPVVYSWGIVHGKTSRYSNLFRVGTRNEGKVNEARSRDQDFADSPGDRTAGNTSW